MSQNIPILRCPFCGSLDITLNSTDETITCNSCGCKTSMHISQFLSQPDTMSSAGTVVPTPPVEIEEVFGYRRRVEVFPHTHEEFKILENEIKELTDILKQHDIKLEQLSGVFPRVVVVEEIPKEDAKQKVEEYFKEHETADIEELMLSLKIPVQTLVEIIDDLKREGKLTTEDEEET